VLRARLAEPALARVPARPVVVGRRIALASCAVVLAWILLNALAGNREERPDAALAAVLEAREYAVCVQDARDAPPPGGLVADPAIRSYYLLELTGAARGVLLVAHTDASPRGFTTLCRHLGVRVGEVASAILGLGLTREWIAAEAARLQTSFAELEA